MSVYDNLDLSNFVSRKKNGVIDPYTSIIYESMYMQLLSPYLMSYVFTFLSI